MRTNSKLFWRSVFIGILLAFVSCILSCVVGCSSFTSNLIPPIVQLQQIDLGEATLNDATLIFQLAVENPNLVPLKVDKVNYQFLLNGQALTKGILDRGLAVEAHSKTLIPVPIQVKYSDLAHSLRDLLQQGRSPYQLDGTVHLGWIQVPFQQIGELKLSDLQKK